jgi:hypothetical protein
MHFPRRRLIRQIALALMFISPAAAQNEEASRMPTWQDEIAKGLVPYHQLTVEDFRVDDKASGRQLLGETIHRPALALHPAAKWRLVLRVCGPMDRLFRLRQK